MPDIPFRGNDGVDAATGGLLRGGFPAFETARPDSATRRERRRGELRRALRRLLGDLPPTFVPQVTISGSENRSGYVIERFAFDNGIGDTVYGYTLIPDGRAEPGPAILYHHWHAEQYELGKDEVLTSVHPDLDFATGEELVRRGYVVQCIDAYGFGERRFQGPAGRKEYGAQVEAALFKTFLWEGRTLWGMMVRDDMLALNYLASRREVDPQRIAAMGVSMGSTRTWWLAALDDRVKVAVCVACLTRYQNLIAHGSVNAHGIYYYVPNLLKEGISRPWKDDNLQGRDGPAIHGQDARATKDRLRQRLISVIRISLYHASAGAPEWICRPMMPVCSRDSSGSV
jgi:hypothetical protein